MTFSKYNAFAGLAMAAAILMACNAQPKEQEAAAQAEQLNIERTEEVSPTGQEMHVATLTISGMGCQMACGSKISNTLAGLQGVSTTEIDFIGAGEANSAVVHFDAEKITEQQMIEAVNGMKGGHYEVTSVKLVHYKASQPKQPEAAAEDAEEGKVSYRQGGLFYNLPDFFGVFSRLF